MATIGKTGRIEVFHDVEFFSNTSVAKAATVGHFACSKSETAQSLEFIDFCKWACEQAHTVEGQPSLLGKEITKQFKLKVEELNKKFDDRIYVVEFEFISL